MLRRTGSVTLGDRGATETGAHTLAFDSVRQRLYVFLPDTGQGVVYLDAPDEGGLGG